jgi:hypothetical protein
MADRAGGEHRFHDGGTEPAGRACYHDMPLRQVHARDDSAGPAARRD